MAKTKDIQIVKKNIKRYLELLKMYNIKVIDAYLFGSYAKGNAREDSDIDVAIITNDFLGDEFEFQLLLMKYARDIDADIEPHPYLEKDFSEDNPNINNILSIFQYVTGVFITDISIELLQELLLQFIFD